MFFAFATPPLNFPDWSVPYQGHGSTNFDSLANPKKGRSGEGVCQTYFGLEALLFLLRSSVASCSYKPLCGIQDYFNATKLALFPL